LLATKKQSPKFLNFMTAQEARTLMTSINVESEILKINTSIDVMAKAGHNYTAYQINPNFIPALKKHFEENGFTVKLSDVSPDYFEVNW